MFLVLGGLVLQPYGALSWVGVGRLIGVRDPLGGCGPHYRSGFRA